MQYFVAAVAVMALTAQAAPQVRRHDGACVLQTEVVTITLPPLQPTSADIPPGFTIITSIGTPIGTPIPTLPASSVPIPAIPAPPHPTGPPAEIPPVPVPTLPVPPAETPITPAPPTENTCSSGKEYCCTGDAALSLQCALNILGSTCPQTICCINNGEEQECTNQSGLVLEIPITVGDVSILDHGIPSLGLRDVKEPKHEEEENWCSNGKKYCCGGDAFLSLQCVASLLAPTCGQEICCINNGGEQECTNQSGLIISIPIEIGDIDAL